MLSHCFIRFTCYVNGTRACQDEWLRGVLHTAGPASVTCAETLRQEGFKGRIVLACREKTLPYDRPKLSKVRTHVCEIELCCIFSFKKCILGPIQQAMHLTPDAIALRPGNFYEEHDIDLMLGKEVNASLLAIYSMWL